MLELPDSDESVARWHRLFFQGEFFGQLKPTTDFRLLKASLEDWDKWQQSYEVPDKRYSFNTSEWKRQFEKVGSLLDLGTAANKLSGILSREDFEFFKFDGADIPKDSWHYACYLLLKGKKRQQETNLIQKVNVLMEVPSSEDFGLCCELEIELHTDGIRGEIYPDPLKNTLCEYDVDFLESIREIWNHLRNTEFKNKNLGVIDASFSLNYKTDQDALHIPDFIWAFGGRSAMAAFYLCLRHILLIHLGEAREFELNDESFAISAEIGDLWSGKLSGVTGLKNKIQAAAEKGIYSIFVANANEEEIGGIKEYLKNRKFDVTIRCIQHIGEVEEYFKNEFKRVFINQQYRNYQHLEWLGKKFGSVEIKDSFQLMPMLITINEEQLLNKSERGKDISDETDVFGLRKASESEIRHWEEEILRKEFIAIETSHSISNVFNEFRRIVKSDKFTPFEEVTDVPRFIMLGSPGGGKSTFCRYLIWACGQQIQPDGLRDIDGNQWKMFSRSGIQLVPVRVKLAEWESCFDRKSPAFNLELMNLSNYLAKTHSLANGWDNVSISPEKWRNWLDRGEILLLFDGLDEIRGEKQFQTELRRSIMETAQNCPTIITCRTVSYETHQKFMPGFPIFTLAGLTDEQRDNFIKAYLENVTESEFLQVKDWIDKSNLQLLAANPFLLSIICFVLQNVRNEQGNINENLPKTRSELYQNALLKLLESNSTDREDTSYFLPDPLQNPVEKQLILEPVAFDLWNYGDNKQLVFKSNEIKDKFIEPLRKKDYQSRDEVKKNDSLRKIAGHLFDDLKGSSRLFIGSDLSNYSFIHLTIHEFLAASALAKKDDHLKIALANLYDVNWSEVLAMLGGALAILDEREKKLETVETANSKETAEYSPRAERYIAELLIENKRDMFFRPFFAAVAAAVEAGAKIKPGTKEDLLNKTMELYFNPPDYLENDFFLPLIRLWNNDAVKILHGKLREYLDDGKSGSD